MRIHSLFVGAIMSDNKSNGTAKLCPYKILKDLPKVLPTDFVLPNLPSRCTWTSEKDQQSPHPKRSL